jgi:hypothetical protein
MTRCLWVVALWLCAATALPEESRGVTVGSRVRAVGPEVGREAVVGTVVDLQPDKVLVQSPGSSEPIAVPIAPSTIFEVSGGRRSHPLNGALVGAAIGATPGFLLTFGDYSDPDPSPGAVAAVGAAAGAAVGAVVGLFLKSEDWYLAEPHPVSAGIAPVQGGVAFSFQVAWGSGHHWAAPAADAPGR